MEDVSSSAAQYGGIHFWFCNAVQEATPFYHKEQRFAIPWRTVSESTFLAEKKNFAGFTTQTLIIS